MTDVKKCDRCSEIYEETEREYGVYKEGDADGLVPYDLCPGCLEILVKYLHGGEFVDRTSQEETAPVDKRYRKVSQRALDYIEKRLEKGHVSYVKLSRELKAKLGVSVTGLTVRTWIERYSLRKPGVLDETIRVAVQKKNVVDNASPATFGEVTEDEEILRSIKPKRTLTKEEKNRRRDAIARDEEKMRAWRGEPEQQVETPDPFDEYLRKNERKKYDGERLNFEASYQYEDVVTMADAEKRASEILAKYSVPQWQPCEYKEFEKMKEMKRCNSLKKRH